MRFRKTTTIRLQMAMPGIVLYDTETTSIPWYFIDGVERLGWVRGRKYAAITFT